MEKIEDIRPTADLSPEMIKTICDAITRMLRKTPINPTWTIRGLG